MGDRDTKPEDYVLTDEDKEGLTPEEVKLVEEGLKVFNDPSVPEAFVVPGKWEDPPISKKRLAEIRAQVAAEKAAKGEDE